LLVSPAGFFLFVGLAFYFCTHPPTPLAVTAEHVEVLLHDLQQQVQQQLHSLHVGDNLQALGHGLSERVHALEHSLQDSVHALEHRLQDGVHKLEGRLSESLADNLHQLQVRDLCSSGCTHVSVHVAFEKLQHHAVRVLQYCLMLSDAFQGLCTACRVLRLLGAQERPYSRITSSIAAAAAAVGSQLKCVSTAMLHRIQQRRRPQHPAARRLLVC
jgi:hypothetical protein